MRLNFNVAVTVPPMVKRIIQDLRGIPPERVFPRTMQRLSDLAQLGRNEWIERSTKIPGQDGRPLALAPFTQLSRTDLAESISATPARVEGGQLRAEVYSHARQAVYVERGTPGGEEMDLHTLLAHARKARVSKAGKKYLSIPFRHATTAPGGPGGQRFQAPGAQPGAGALTSGLLRVMAAKPRYVRGRYLGQVPSQTLPGKSVRKFLYVARTDDGTLRPKSEARLTLAELEAINARARTHKISPEHMKRLVGLMHVGRKGHGAYLTIRTLSEANPEGWRIPAYPAQRLASQTAASLRRVAQVNFFDEAIRQDLLALFATVDR